MRQLRHLPHLVFLVIGLLVALRLALPLDLAENACPPAGEGRGMCVLQKEYAPAATTIALALAFSWLVADLLFVRIPAMRNGERVKRPPRRGHGREAVQRDETLRAASWGILPPPRRGTPRPQITVAAVLGTPQLRAVGPLDGPRPPAEHPIRIRPGKADGPDKTLLAACWDVATRRSAELIDALAVDLGLARDPVQAAPAIEPDPLLTAATWARLPTA
jgi:hypothetical protein